MADKVAAKVAAKVAVKEAVKEAVQVAAKVAAKVVYILRNLVQVSILGQTSFDVVLDLFH